LARLGLVLRRRLGVTVAAQDFSQLLPGVFQVVGLVARELARDLEAAFGIQARGGSDADARFELIRERRALFEVEAQIDLARDLVYVLATRTRCAHRSPAKLGFGNDEVCDDKRPHSALGLTPISALRKQP
jgi:hypothetical protein